jgi:protein phosphatase 2C family protein 2/3
MTKPDGKDSKTWPKCSFFAIYDGHGGSNCADFLKDHLHTIIINQPCFPKDPYKAL